MKIERGPHGQLIVNGRRCLVSYIRGEWYKLPPEKYVPVSHDLMQIRKYYDGPVGIAVALPSDDGDILYGYSKIDVNGPDRKLLAKRDWRERAIQIAVGRALTNPASPPFYGLRPEIAEVLSSLATKAERYFYYIALHMPMSESWS